MQSYKLRKNSETSMFPIEDELRKLRNDNEKNWTNLMAKIMSVVFSGIGTTLLCQKEFLPTFIKWLATYIGLKLANGWVYVIEFLLAVGFFTLTSFLAFKVINWADNNKDEKKMSPVECIQQSISIK